MRRAPLGGAGLGGRERLLAGTRGGAGEGPSVAELEGGKASLRSRSGLGVRSGSGPVGVRGETGRFRDLPAGVPRGPKSCAGEGSGPTGEEGADGVEWRAGPGHALAYGKGESEGARPLRAIWGGEGRRGRASEVASTFEVRERMVWDAPRERCASVRDEKGACLQGTWGGASEGPSVAELERGKGWKGDGVGVPRVARRRDGAFPVSLRGG